MKLPMPAPDLATLTRKYIETLGTILDARIGPEVNGAYEHWDKVRHRAPPAGLNAEQWWLGITWTRAALLKPLPLLLDKTQQPFKLALTDSMQRHLHYIDREAAGSVKGVDAASGQGRFMIRSLIEEAMTSSQLEGASTTRAVAKEMLSTGRAPRDQSERMIYNNYVAMNVIRERGIRAITPGEILELHSILTDGTLELPTDSGRFRTAEDNVAIFDRGSPPTLLHTPPPAEEVPARIERLCTFINEESTPFVHPVAKAIALHFQIGYDHPFVDGNGRTARALFYWAMMNAGYWMTEYFSISSVLKKSPGKYMRAYLYTESDNRDLGYFVAQQLEAIEQSIQGLHAYIARKHAEDQAARRMLRTARLGGMQLNHRQRALLANALKDPDRTYTVASHQAAHTITYPTALKDLNGLVTAGLVSKERVGKASEYLVLPGLSERLVL
ncbi:Fic family protein [Stenotrophomonas maltophilia]|uniref:Fic family protein n=1 Tax=Stenotrophomonas maltophilia TaxID=40324 RepID=UPI00209ACB94|nr:Fic family protein [Stenotrophomonas maltophilia]MBN4960364.1 Fic family protein [Stenotrophomonas maltophilia]MBN4968495.1 Fic family protein [Stenotrophomonas maltophilia]MCO7487527.1 Fic family protein [Stenotrophomonas maltophilia]